MLRVRISNPPRYSYSDFSLSIEKYSPVIRSRYLRSHPLDESSKFCYGFVVGNSLKLIIAFCLVLSSFAFLQDDTIIIAGILRLTGAILWADGVASIAQSKGYGRLLWFVLGFFFSLLAAIAVFLIPETEQMKQAKAEDAYRASEVEAVKKGITAQARADRKAEKAESAANGVPEAAESPEHEPTGPNPNLCVGCGALMAPTMPACPRCKLARATVG